LAGNPNAGKSSIFNALTGSRQHVGNWPGKTVEKKEGRLKIDGQEIAVVDLPGTYSLSAFSLEEIIARNFIVDEQPDAILCVVDEANLERNLYLVMQVMEMGVPIALALNMSDVAAARGIHVDVAELSRRMGGVPVMETVGNRAGGIPHIKSALLQIAAQSATKERPAGWAPLTLAALSPDLRPHVDALAGQIAQDPHLQRYRPDWLALKLLEEDSLAQAWIEHNPALAEAAQDAVTQIMDETGDDAETLIAEARYSAIAELVRGAVTRPAQDMVTSSDRLDLLMTHRIWGVPIFLGLMWFVFQLTANVSAPFVDFVDGVINGPVAGWISGLLALAGLGGSWVEAMVVDGIIAGVGGVLVFVPVLAMLYLAIAVLEDTGYMARAAFVMDRLMSRLGLHGKSFLPMLVGFGCTVPAIYATRTLENERDRKITAFLTTFMSCGARLPVYVIFGAALFGAAGGSLIFAMYLTGIGVAILTSLLFTKLIYRGKPVPPFVMELPPYRAPNLKTVFGSAWDRTKAFVRKAGTVILLVSMLVWLLLATPLRPGVGSFTDVEPVDSVFGGVSQAVAPLFAPAGFGEWQASGALVTGVLAKEVVVSTLAQVYYAQDLAGAEAGEAGSFLADLGGIGLAFGEAVILAGQELLNILPRTVNLFLAPFPNVGLGELDLLGLGEEAESLTSLQAALAHHFTPLSALAFCIFVLLYTPCMVAMAAMRQEFGSRWALLQGTYTLGVAWFAATLVFQIGRFLGWA
jgi:ferrous iron transport protein B